MSWPLGNLKILVLSWLVAEILILWLAVKTVGFGATMLLMLGTTILGFSMLRRIGFSAAQHLRRAMTAGGDPNDAFVEGSLTVVGAVLLILPGFVSDLIGLALTTPSIRQGLIARFLPRGNDPRPAAAGRRTQPDVIDLAPSDWRVVEKPNRP